MGRGQNTGLTKGPQLGFRLTISGLTFLQDLMVKPDLSRDLLSIR